MRPFEFLGEELELDPSRLANAHEVLGAVPVKQVFVLKKEVNISSDCAKEESRTFKRLDKAQNTLPLSMAAVVQEPPTRPPPDLKPLSPRSRPRKLPSPRSKSR